MATKAADQLVSVLMDWQVKHVFGLPGDSIDTTVDALRRHLTEKGQNRDMIHFGIIQTI